MKKTQGKKISDEVLDSLVRTCLRLMSGGYCKRCKRYVGVNNIEVAHLYRRHRKTVRWDLRNVWPLCKNDPATGRVGCHQEIDNDQIKLVSFMYDVLSLQDIEALQMLANRTIKEYPIDREEIKLDLKDRIKTLEG